MFVGGCSNIWSGPSGRRKRELGKRRAAISTDSGYLIIAMIRSYFCRAARASADVSPAGPTSITRPSTSRSRTARTKLLYASPQMSGSAGEMWRAVTNATRSWRGEDGAPAAGTASDATDAAMSARSFIGEGRSTLILPPTSRARNHRPRGRRGKREREHPALGSSACALRESLPVDDADPAAQELPEATV